MTRACSVSVGRTLPRPGSRPASHASDFWLISPTHYILTCVTVSRGYSHHDKSRGPYLRLPNREMNSLPANRSTWSYLPPLRSFSSSRNIYRNKPHAASADDICPICRDMYSPEGCSAIRLDECGHVFGDKCFRNWITNYPRTCPYFSHTLKYEIQFVTKKTHPLARRMEMIILYICGTPFWAFFDDLFVRLLIHRCSTPTKIKVHRSLRALYGGTFEVEEAIILRSTYRGMFVNLWINLAIVPILSILFISGVGSILASGHMTAVNRIVCTVSLGLSVSFGSMLVIVGLGFLLVLEGIMQLSLQWDVRTMKLQ